MELHEIHSKLRGMLDSTNSFTYSFYWYYLDEVVIKEVLSISLFFKILTSVLEIYSGGKVRKLRPLLLVLEFL